MKFLFTMGVIFGILLLWAFALPRPQIERPQIDHVTINPYATADPETLSIENPSWVFPLIIEHSVTVTIYHAVPGQTDDSPNVLADGTRIDTSIAGSYRFCALSRNLLERWDGPYAYGDTIFLEGAGKFSGPWIVKDTMNRRFVDRMDLLVDIDVKNHKFEFAKIRKVS